jgi:hypothetical protein
MRQIAVPLFWVLLLAMAVGLLAGLALEQLEIAWYWGPVSTVSLTIFDAWVKARGLLSKRLGHKDQAYIVSSSRSIPVSFESVLRGKGRSVDVIDEIQIVCPSKDVIDQAEIKLFIGRSLARQYRGKQGLSRHYHCRVARPALSREKYEALIEALEARGFIQGRRQGRPGHIIADFDTIIKALRGE